jgi:hypothetical protein
VLKTQSEGLKTSEVLSQQSSEVYIDQFSLDSNQNIPRIFFEAVAEEMGAVRIPYGDRTNEPSEKQFKQPLSLTP